MLAEKLNVGRRNGGKVRRFDASVCAVDFDCEIETLSQINGWAGGRDVERDFRENGEGKEEERR